MTNRLHIVASCTDRKRMAAGPPVRLRDVPDGPVGKRARAWSSRLRRRSSPVFPARDLYAGAAWSVIREFPELARSKGLRARLWVASAGYGLVADSAPLVSYSATFASRQLDAVAPKLAGEAARQAHRQWWNALATTFHPGHEAPRSLVELAEHHPRDRFMVVGSPDYIHAMADDLRLAIASLRSPEQLFIVTSTRTVPMPGLEPHRVPSDGSLLAAFEGGSRISLHALVAEKILRESQRWPLEASVLQKRYRSLVARLPALPRYERKPQTDAQVRRFIVRALRGNRKAARTTLLRAFRSEGRQCEQQRFRRLFEEVVATHGP